MPDGATPPAGAAEPDYRYTLANERTFLSWIRTALALIAGGIALKAFAGSLDPQWLTTATAVLATVLGGTLAVLGHRHWRDVQAAMRRGDPLPPQVAAPLLTVGVVVLAIALAIGIVL